MTDATTETATETSTDASTEVAKPAAVAGATPTDGAGEVTGVESQRAIGLALLRITLGVIIVWTWWGNVGDDLYTGDGLTGLINWLFDEENGNGSTLGFYQSFLDSVVVPNAGFFATVQLVVELAFGLALILGLFTRLASLAAGLFFLSLFLGYYGGEEWIWTYVILGMSTVAVFLGRAGRTFGLDQLVVQRSTNSRLHRLG